MIYGPSVISSVGFFLLISISVTLKLTLSYHHSLGSTTSCVGRVTYLFLVDWLPSALTRCTPP